MGSHSNTIHAALDFWHKAGYSSSESVFGKKPKPVCDTKMEQYLEYNESSESEEEDTISSDYKRRVKRQKLRQKKLKWIHGDIFDAMRDAQRVAGL